MLCAPRPDFAWHAPSLPRLNRSSDSGIGEEAPAASGPWRLIVGLRCSIRLEAPVVAAGVQLAPDEYIKTLVAAVGPCGVYVMRRYVTLCAPRDFGVCVYR